ncbi:hypothetical protein FIBSPDRAFT_546592 [Athelia psychrophila]|uniref:Uncharacterized protein n=1 Tax=Athelia psychrophila TaxID=1759441 RepID=A0A166IP86_9AGAM|nr:hypothetical protein FIBSPDRAFT_546592 [Fibularhizoctonia sp. CBS 109695]
MAAVGTRRVMVTLHSEVVSASRWARNIGLNSENLPKIQLAASEQRLRHDMKSLARDEAAGIAHALKRTRADLTGDANEDEAVVEYKGEEEAEHVHAATQATIEREGEPWPETAFRAQIRPDQQVRSDAGNRP